MSDPDKILFQNKLRKKEIILNELEIPDTRKIRSKTIQSVKTKNNNSPNSNLMINYSHSPGFPIAPRKIVSDNRIGEAKIFRIKDNFINSEIEDSFELLNEKNEPNYDKKRKTLMKDLDLFFNSHPKGTETLANNLIEYYKIMIDSSEKLKINYLEKIGIVE